MAEPIVLDMSIYPTKAAALLERIVQAGLVIDLHSGKALGQTKTITLTQDEAFILRCARMAGEGD